MTGAKFFLIERCMGISVPLPDKEEYVCRQDHQQTAGELLPRGGRMVFCFFAIQENI